MSYEYIIVPEIDYSKPNLFTHENTADLILWAKNEPPGIHYLQLRVYPQLMVKVIVTPNGDILSWMRTGYKT